MAKNKKTPKVDQPSTISKSSQPSSGTIYRVGDTGYAVDTVGKYLENQGTGYVYNGQYDQAFKDAVAVAKTNLLGGSNYKGGTFGNATLRAIEAANLAKAQEEQNNSYMQEFQNMQAQINAAMEQNYQQQVQAQQSAINGTIQQIESNKSQVEAAYQEAQKQAYINNVLQQKQMGDYLSAAGYTGGMTESTLGQIANNYDNNRQKATSERDSALLKIQDMIAEARNSGNTALAGLASKYLDNYQASLQNQMQINYNIHEAEQAQKNADRDYAWQLNKYRNEQNWNEKMYQSQEKEKVAANKYNAFMDYYQTRYNSKDKYKAWIEDLEREAKRTGDPYGYIKNQIGYLKAWVNKGMDEAKKAAVQGSGKGGSGRGRSGSSKGTSEIVNLGGSGKNISISQGKGKTRSSEYNQIYGSLTSWISGNLRRNPNMSNKLIETQLANTLNVALSQEKISVKEAEDIYKSIKNGVLDRRS